MECHISVVDHKTTRLCIALSAHGSTRAKCIRSNGRIQIRSNTKDARTGRNTIKIQHKRCKSWTKYKYIHPRSSRYACNRNTESTMRVESILYVTGDISNLCMLAAYRVSSSGTSWRFHLAVYHKTTRLCIALSAHGSTRAKCIRSNGRNTNKIQHKRCKNWTKYKYIDPHSSRYACNRNTESTMGEEATSVFGCVSPRLASSCA